MQSEVERCAGKRNGRVLASCCLDEERVLEPCVLFLICGQHVPSLANEGNAIELGDLVRRGANHDQDDDWKRGYQRSISVLYNPSTPGSDPTVGYPGRILRWGWMRVKSRNLQSEEKMRRGSRPRLGTCSLTRRRKCRWPRCSPRSGWSLSLHCSDRDPKIQLRWDGSSSTGAHLDEQSP